MNENDKHFIKRYEELLNKGYCDCNEMNCIDNNSPRRILNIVNNLQSKIDKVNRILNANTHVENIYHALCNLFDEEYQYEIDNEELNKILKVDK